MRVTASEHSQATDSLVFGERVRILFADAVLPVVFNLANALFLSLLMLGRAAETVIWAWFAANVAINAGRLLMLWQYRRAPDRLSPRLWARIVTLISGLNGVQWAASVLLFANHGDPIATAYVIFFIGGMSAAASLRMAIFPETALAFTLPPLLALAGFLVAGEGWQPKLLATVVIMFAIASTRLIHLTADNLAAAIRQRFTNERLAASLQEALVRAGAAQRSQNAFLANISHEIRTPMNAVVNMVELAKTSDDRAERVEMLRIAQNAAHGLLDLFNDILDLSRLEQGGISIDRGKVDHASLIADVAAMMRMEARAKGLSLTHNAAPGPAILADAKRLRQILINLLGNAVKFTDSGEVSIAARLWHDTVTDQCLLDITVTDTGVGIAPEHVEHIFQRFRQADESITRRFQGSGLGLAISRELAELMGGSLTVDSRLGEGSRFHLRIPVEPADASASQGSSAGIINTAGKRLHLLVVDDNQINRLLLAKILQSAGIHASLAESGEQALNLLAPAGGGPAAKYDAVLMDIQMPGLDGFATTAHIRALGNDYEDLPIIAVSAHDYSDDMARLRQAGFDGFIAKPVEAGKLIAMVNSAAEFLAPATSAQMQTARSSHG
ncbi:MAG: hypothetical protein Tsb0016_17320 [Sphingomonadales bacterium]